MALRVGERLGPYEILGPVGAGGMGEVYRARDPRLGRDVAVKVISTEGTPSAERLRRFEDEARAVAALSHPNVLTVHDVGTQEGAPYVVFELLEGETLRERLRRGPLPLRSAVEAAVQVCRGLQAAHAGGILHRDLKPENLFLTSDGFVKILDFGLAKLTRGEGAERGLERTPTVAGVVMGTPGYLSPEQARGQEADPRSDIFALGAVLYEALSGRRAFAGETAADAISAILHEDPPPVRTVSGPLPTPVDRIVRRCLEKEPENRFHSAHDLALALEAVLERPAGPAAGEEEEARSPYPGLSSFTEQDAGRFFGREGEVEALWRRIRERRLQAVIGPSGAGKTSFVRAGVVASRPSGWTAAVTTPGSSPLLMLGQALAPELQGDVVALRQLVRFEDPETAFEVLTRWRKAHAQALLVVDQFEELFTQCPPEAQAGFAALLGRLAGEAGVHVVLSMRDDFLMRCHEHEALAPVFAELTPLGPLTGDALRRALEQPARAEGFRFEEGLVGKMTAAVEGERGALPLLAFAVSRLWEKRDRVRKVLTHEAYAEAGGVAGALARHAEETLARIGTHRQGMVREVFRNLVTSQGTRAASEREELLSVFPDRRAAEEVLDQLVSGRLLTSWEMPIGEGASEAATRGPAPGRHRIEIVHESLLRSWLRLVRWQAQDAEGALLRDQLKQAAHLWQEKSRTSDLLWTGTAFQEFALWRGRYAGALTALEEDFARAMAQQAQRQRRLRRLVAGSVVAAALIVAVITGGLWWRSEAAREEAKAEALRAEAGKLLALGRAEIDRYPTAALAYVRRSLELADTPEARRFAVEVLWSGPVVRILSPDRALGGLDQPENPGWRGLVFSPDARWLALRNGHLRRILLFPADGGTPRTVPHPQGEVYSLAFGPRSDRLIVGGRFASLPVWSVPDLRELPRFELGGIGSAALLGGGGLYTVTERAAGDPHRLVRRWSEPGRGPETVGTFQWNGADFSLHPAGRSLVTVSGRSVGLVALGRQANAERVLGSHPDIVSEVAYFPAGDRVASLDQSGEIRIWSPDAGAKAPPRILRGMRGWGILMAGHPEGRNVAAAGVTGVDSLHLWDLHDPPDAAPAVLKWLDAASGEIPGGWFESSGRWLVMTTGYRLGFWPVASPRRRTLPGYDGPTWGLVFTPDGRWLASCPQGKAVRLWPLNPAHGEARSLWPTEPEFAPQGVLSGCNRIAIHPAGTQVAVVTQLPFGVLLVPTTGGPSRRLPTDWDGEPEGGQVAFDPGGLRAIACPSISYFNESSRLRTLNVRDLATGRGRSVSLAPFTDASWSCDSVAFAPDGAVFVGGNGGILRVVLPNDPSGTVSAERLHAAGRAVFALSADGRKLLVWAGRNPGAGVFEDLLLYDLVTHTSKRITTHGQRLWTAAFDPSGRVIVTGDNDGVVRVGPATGEEPHLLSGGHAGQVTAVAVSPDGRWIASVSDGGSFHLWPMPDVTKPPLHTLPHAELMATLDALTNLQVVRAPTSSTGWKLDVGPFPGWKDVPTW